MRYVFFSDLHNSHRMDLLLKFAEAHEHDISFGLGDYGSLFNSGNHGSVFHSCASAASLQPLYSLYGNHDDVVEIQNSIGWLKDGLIVLPSGLRIFSVNGIWGTRPSEKPWHHAVGNMVKLMVNVGEVDLLLTHEHPAFLDYFYANDKFKFHEGRDWHVTFANAVKTYLNPHCWFYGHSRSNVAERMVPDLNLRTVGLDGRFVVTDDKFKITTCEETGNVPF